MRLYRISVTVTASVFTLPETWTPSNDGLKVEEKLHGTDAELEEKSELMFKSINSESIECSKA